MAVPKRKTSHARKSSRRSTVWKLNAPTLTTCPNCGELMEGSVILYLKTMGGRSYTSVRPFVL